MTSVKFSDIHAPRPEIEPLTAEYSEWLETIEKDPSETVSCVRQWDERRRAIGTWIALVELRFNQDTKNPDYQEARKQCDRLRPKLTELDVKMKQQLLEPQHREQVKREFGEHVTRLWEVDVLTYDPIIEEDLVREAELEAAYNELLAGAELQFQGETYNHSEIIKFLESPDRKTRYEADQVQWQWFADNRATLDDLYDQLVRLRHAMAGKLGFRDYIELGYKRMMRIDYTRADVEKYRESVRQHVVPLVAELNRQQAERLGLDTEDLRHWDEALHDQQGNPKPHSDYDVLIQAAQQMFDDLGHGLDDFFHLMCDADLMDLKIRSGKAGGGFCTSFDSYGLPFIFANFNGTKGDVEVFTHEMGHAFQGYMSREQSLSDYLWPTYESCEIHSMGLEFLTYPYMDRFFGEEADRFRTIHLSQALKFLPYGVAVDQFQHLVYSEPEASPAKRFALWKQTEQQFLPWRDYGDLTHPAEGGRWQLQRHIYMYPFYYIDYTLAQACALQLWVRAEEDRQTAMQDYVKLCRRGGEAPFQELVRSANLTSPFKDGCLDSVVKQASAILL